MNKQTRQKTDIFLCLHFLTRLPIPLHLLPNEERKMSEAVWAFPIAGILSLLPIMGSAAIMTALHLPNVLIATIAIAIHIAVTGALHDDGLADVADGFGGGRTKERKLEIMKDSTLGTYGASALVAAFAIKTALYSTLLAISLPTFLYALMAAESAARIAQIHHWRTLEPARNTGLSHGLGQPSKTAWHITLLTAGILLIICSLLARGPLSALIAILFATLAYVAFNRLTRHQINGQSGDTIGAVFMVIKIVFLTGLLTFMPELP